MAQSNFRFDAHNLVDGFSQLGAKAEIAMMMYAQTGALRLQNYARQNRPWTDRTGHARQRLTGKASRVDTGFQIELSHGVDYGIWLENAHEKRFAILEPTIQAEGPAVVKGFEHLLEKLR